MNNNEWQNQSLNVVDNSVGAMNNTNNPNMTNAFSKKCKILMIVTLIGTLIMFLDKFITSSDWYWSLMTSTIYTHNESLKLALENLSEIIEIFNWIIVLNITCVSIFFLFKDKKQNQNISIYQWYIFAGALCIFVGFSPLLIYCLSTWVIILKHKAEFEYNKIYLILASIVSLIILAVVLINVATVIDNTRIVKR